MRALATLIIDFEVVDKELRVALVADVMEELYLEVVDEKLWNAKRRRSRHCSVIQVDTAVASGPPSTANSVVDVLESAVHQVNELQDVELWICHGSEYMIGCVSWMYVFQFDASRFAVKVVAC